MRRHIGFGLHLISALIGQAFSWIGSGPAFAQEKNAAVYRLDYVEIHRGFNLRSADEPKVLTPTKEETFKGRPDNIEIALTTYWYTHKAVLTVDAPEKVTEGQEVTITASVVSTFDLKEDSGQSQPEVSVRINLPAGDVQTTSDKAPLKPGSYTVKASKSIKARFDGKDALSYSQDKGVRYAKFSIDMRTTLSNQMLISAYWFYRADPATPSQPGKIDVAVTGGKTVAEPMTITATVHDPAPGQTVRLELPPGLELATGQQVGAVPKPAAGSNTSIVTWQVKPARPGQYELRVSSGSVSTPQTVMIGPAAGSTTKVSAAKFMLSLPKESAAGKPFLVTAHVADPLDVQTLTLVLAPKLALLEGPERQVVPQGAKETTLTWKVKAAEPGQFQVSVRSSTGAAETRSVTINPTTREFTLLDAQRALKMSVDLIPQEMELDVDGSAHVDSRDALLILQMAGARLEKRP